MDSYLEIARAVLRSSRQPLSARQILKTALQLQLVPRDLYGRTQHKTLQARLASDILKRRSKSEFYRTGPGRFFLRALQSDRSIPHRYRQEYQAPLRAAQLGRFDVVAFPRSSLRDLATKVRSSFSISKLLALPWQFVRLHTLRRDPKLVPLRFLLLLVTNGRIFVDNRRPPPAEGDLHRRSILGLDGYVKLGDLSLFSSDDFGLMDAAIRTLLEQFELPGHVRPLLDQAERWSAGHAVIDVDSDAHADLLVFLSFQCADISEIFDAIAARPSADWMSTPVKVNDLDRFDKWSVRLIQDTELQTALCG